MTRTDACVSVYLPTSPPTRESAVNGTELKNLSDASFRQPEYAGFDKRRMVSLDDRLAPPSPMASRKGFSR